MCLSKWCHLPRYLGQVCMMGKWGATTANWATKIFKVLLKNTFCLHVFILFTIWVKIWVKICVKDFIIVRTSLMHVQTYSLASQTHFCKKGRVWWTVYTSSHHIYIVWSNHITAFCHMTHYITVGVAMTHCLETDDWCTGLRLYTSFSYPVNRQVLTQHVLLPSK